MSRRLQLLLLAGLLIPGVAQAQAPRPRMGLIRPWIERQQVRLQDRQQTLHQRGQQLRMHRDLIRQRALDRVELRHRIRPGFRSPALRRFTLPRRPGLLGRHYIRI